MSQGWRAKTTSCEQAQAAASLLVPPRCAPSFVSLSRAAIPDDDDEVDNMTIHFIFLELRLKVELRAA